MNPVLIQVVDNAGTPETGAQVRLIEESSVGSAEWPFTTLPVSHKHKSGGNYEHVPGNPAAPAPGAGNWLLVVSRATPAASPVVQKLTLVVDGGELKAVPGWGKTLKAAALANQAATVTIVNFGQAPVGSAIKAAQTQITVKLFPRSEVVFMSCHEHLASGITFRFYGEGRRDLLYKAGTLDDGTIVTLMVCQSRELLTQIKSADKKPPSGHKSWVTVGSSIKAAIVAGEKRPVVSPAVKEIGILDFYGHLHTLGSTAPGTVLEAGIFGHGYHEGPILWNTDDHSKSIRATRDPLDIDGRQKDWLGTTISTSFASLPAAFKGSAAMHMWGCNHMKNVIIEARTANAKRKAKTPPNDMFTISLENGEERASINHVTRNIANYYRGTVLHFMEENGDASGIPNYHGAMAQFLKIPCFGAPPGMGANLGMKNGSNIMLIDASPGTENAAPMEFYKAVYGADFQQDPLGYLDYNAIQAATLPDPGWSTERWIRYKDDARAVHILRLPSGHEIYRSKAGTYKTPSAASSFGGNTGHLYVAPGAASDHVEVRDTLRVLILSDSKTQDVGIFVRTDGVILLLTRPLKGTFTIDTSALETRTMQFDGRFNWKDSTPAITTSSSSGILQTVTPGFFW